VPNDRGQSAAAVGASRFEERPFTGRGKANIIAVASTAIGSASGSDTK
jgi:hypothetical protein